MTVLSCVIIFALVSNFATTLVLSAKEDTLDCSTIKCKLEDNNPVCAYDRVRKCYKKFNGGSCDVIIENCKTKGKPYEIIRKGPCCPSTDTPMCDSPTFCTTIYDPICACNKRGCKTFGNECQMNVENAKYNSDFKKRYSGECVPPCYRN